MAHITENDYKKLADAVADDLIGQKIPLNDSISKLATQMDMTHEQVRRLCEASNNATFGKMFQAKDKTASDRIVEFDVADADAVLGGAIKEAGYVSGADNVIALSEYRPLVEDLDEEPVIKTASADEPISHARREVDARTIRKTLDHLRHEKLAAEMAYQDSILNIRNRFKRLYQDVSFDTFEKNAAAIHGERVAGPLTDLRRHLRLPEVTYDYSQLSKTAGYVDDGLIEYKLLADAVAQHTRIAQVSAGIAKLEAL
jgi:AraC-like DNA-binding protein